MHFLYRNVVFIYFEGLNNQCVQYEESNDDYRQLMNLDDVSGSQPSGFILRFPFYVLGERDANVVFAETQYPDWFLDDVYEFSKSVAFYSPIYQFVHLFFFYYPSHLTEL